MRWLNRLMVFALAAALLSSCSFKRKKYENPITKDTQQPDKVLFDKAIADIEKNKFEVARLTLQTLINTYDTSEYLAKAKLAIADSWYREGGGNGLAQAEAEYKDFILFYPTLEEAAESQEKICMIHFKQMEKADRDPNHALKAEQECRQLLVQFPNSKFAPLAEQRLREIQEVLADAEFRVGSMYYRKGSHPASANRMNGLVDQYPLFSHADEALWMQGDSYTRMGPRFKQKATDSYSKIVRDYPMSPYADDAKKKLEGMEAQVPEADPVAMARMKYEAENRVKPSTTKRATSFLRRGPDTSMAAKSGAPTMTNPQPSLPVSIPQSQPEATGFSGDVTISTGGDTSALDKEKDARQLPPGEKAAEGATATDPAKADAAKTDAATTDAAKPEAAAATDEQKPAEQKATDPKADSKSKKKTDKKKKK